jgi:hypothetical protein
MDEASNQSSQPAGPSSEPLPFSLNGINAENLMSNLPALKNHAFEFSYLTSARIGDKDHTFVLTVQ